ncbi:cystatin A2 [Heterostelium album PN500]|uniref:Cystatin A2 n=1 Tax=Heterostelium pallidum (strain ATCC 26659 / Pp 5 / PN500) TaxID=670386 RepID=D3AXE7_HETP5|nr:cystatin A2 [Heterostelium album PN500]EFA86216.1 cystatin A2 [Heterostelium album PN500]|eukprot:XP_020438321.1 cystatin A2 [Heterostelium album PN500]
MIPGGLKPSQPADAAAVTALNAVRHDPKLAHIPGNLEAITYTTQVVAGTNFFIKARTPNGYIHLRIHRALNGMDYSLHSIQEGKTLDDKITYFS